MISALPVAYKSCGVLFGSVPYNKIEGTLVFHEFTTPLADEPDSGLSPQALVTLAMPL